MRFRIGLYCVGFQFAFPGFSIIVLLNVSMFNCLKAIPAGVALASVLFCSHDISAQRISLKTNTIDWVAMSPNLAVEARLSRRVSLQVGVSANPFSFSVFDARLSNYRVEPELRYWFNRPMARHFMALSATAAGFNLRYKDHRCVGDAIGAGISYGYALVLSDHWNMEAEVGVGLAHFSAFNYWCEERPASKNFSRMLPVPIRLGLSFAYVFK